METVLTAFIVIFIILFAMFTFGQAIINSQEALGVTWEQVEAQIEIQAHTHLAFVDAYSSDGGTRLTLTLKNDGDVRLADFSQWDVIVHYSDEMLANNYHVDWLPYSVGEPAAGQWAVDGIYLDAADDQPEVFEPGVLNPGEEVVLAVIPPTAADAGTAIQALLSTTSGLPASYQFHANQPPVLTASAGITVAAGGQKTIAASVLQTTDADDPVSSLVYSITTPPAQGNLSLGDSFTQSDIDAGLLDYTHTGTGDDSFAFTVTDGKDLVGVYSFQITVDVPPEVTTNAGLTLAKGTSGVIGDALLHTTDPDTAQANLVYTITTPPSQGTLSLDGTFTGDDINNGRLYYTHMGSTDDSFEFTVSDGVSVIGPFTFTISTY